MGAGQPSLLVLALACLVTGVRADNTLTALIVSSCIAGLLILLAILGGVIFCVLRYNRNQEDQDKPHAPLANGYYRPGGQPPPSPRARAKAFTQHAPAQRQRPPSPSTP